MGYIKLVSFTQNASQDVKKAFLELKSKNNIKSLVIDLRDNGGGLLNEAVEIVNFFVPKSSLVVSTKGKQKDKNKTYKTTSDPIDTEIPLAVLVNGNTASASEIVSGALQDLDRAVIIGRRTFGKGLVQNIFPLTYNTQVKITVAKYYIPSGRCIQAIDYAHKNASGNPDYIPDSLITAFKTLHGRTVYDGKGIMPDMKTDTLKLSTISFNLITQYLLFDYATQYAATHPTIAPASDFKLSDQDFNDFVAFTDSKGFKFKTAVEQELEQLKKASEYEKNWDEIKPQYDAMEQALANFKKTEIMKQKAEISEMLKEEIVSRYYYQKGRVVASFSGDPDLNKAKDVLNNSPFYTSILDGTYSAGNLSPKTEKK